MVRQQISERLAKRLKEARKAQGLSLDSLAKLSDVSKSMLSQIERSESSPTVAVLWNLTQALNTDFSGLLDDDPKEQGPIKEVIRAGQEPVINTHGTGCKIRILSAPESVGETEIYDLEFDKNGLLESEPHRSGCVENLTVFDGELTVMTDGISETVGSGDTIRYVADRPHSIRARENSRAVLIVVGA
ncbi:XRE family transcriptional regulator [Lentilitoribacter sp. Alg239-R112]|uniref:helix-turn-helix domain-containing protein n=1 Tax=Lentilitoribacter sp. Alg239-R112 TaxID=2305987 RepID=UPI0013A6B0BE|nr:XRE family transcriptional regulator [Lentilitoribacter sp. Alg239-R112]